MSFKDFSQAVHAQYNVMAQHELYTVDVDGDALWQAYLQAFPEGTDPIFRVNTEHTCSCCKNFVRHIGACVAVIDGQIRTVWDNFHVPYPYDNVGLQLRDLVRSRPINGLFRKSERSYGAEQTVEAKPGAPTLTWNHFYGGIAARHFTKEVGAVTGDYAVGVQMFERACAELTQDAFATVRDLIDTNNLYKGQEFAGSVRSLHLLYSRYHALPEAERNTFAWTAAADKVTRLRNSAIGTLLADLSDGMDVENAVKAYEHKTAPENYKRPTALVTPRMVEDAMKVINELGLEPALERRQARLSDISVNNVLWVDNSVQAQMRGGLHSLLLAETMAPVKVSDDSEDISIDDFMANVLPKARSINLVLKNSQQNNFVTLTTAVHDDAPPLFKWGNQFAWSYDGNITDSLLRRQVQSLGGRVDGVLRFSYTWNFEGRNASLMDLHVFMPGSVGGTKDKYGDQYPHGQRVGWNCRNDHQSGGVQDVDYVNPAPEGYVPVENITFPSMDRLKNGEYVFKIHNWNLREPTTSGGRAEIEFDGQVFEYYYPKPLKHKEWLHLATAMLKDGKFSIVHHHAVTSSSQEKWGIKTEVPVKVQTILNSPNHWDGEAVGHKHTIFILEGCKSDQPARGVYNEFLRDGLEKHRKVFELVGNKTKCPVADEQLSGVGFSSTRGDKVIVQVSGDKLRKQYSINF